MGRYETVICSQCECEIGSYTDYHDFGGTVLCKDCYKSSKYEVDPLPVCSECGEEICKGEYLIFFAGGKAVTLCADCSEGSKRTTGCTGPSDDQYLLEEYYAAVL